MITQSEQIDQLAAALADVQALIDGVLKESSNAVYGSRYAELSKVWESFQRVGPDHGLSVVQLPGHFDADARTMSMSVRLMHSSGQWLGGEMSMPLSRADAHAYGSACTYARRYSLASLVGICPHDDDGNAASAFEPSIRQASHQSRPSHSQKVHGLRHINAEPGKLQKGIAAPHNDQATEGHMRTSAHIPNDPQQIGELEHLLKCAGVGADALCQHYRVDCLADLSPRDAARARRALQKKIDPKSAAHETTEVA